MTDRTISEVYFHARTKEGYIDIPLPEIIGEEQEGEEASLEGTLAGLKILLDAGMITRENFEDCTKQAKEKFNG